MDDFTIVFSPRAKQRLVEMADYLYRQNVSNEFVVDYLNQFETWLATLLCQFPESGAPMPKYRENLP